MPPASFAPVETMTSLPPLARALMGLAVAVLAWEMRIRTRRSLARLDDHILRDIGLTSFDAETEVSKPFWSI
jgi:uncharacterized protein YjiS (DUF1127 family)